MAESNTRASTAHRIREVGDGLMATSHVTIKVSLDSSAAVAQLTEIIDELTALRDRLEQDTARPSSSDHGRADGS